MNKNQIISTSVTLVVLAIGAVMLFGNKLPPRTSSAPTTPSSTEVVATENAVVGSADLYYESNDCSGDGHFSSLDVGVAVKGEQYRAPDGVLYQVAGDADESLKLYSILRTDGCFVFDEPLELTSYTAESVPQ